MTGYFALYIAFTVRIVDKAYIDNLSESLAQFLDSYFLDQAADNEVIALGWFGGVSGVGLTVRNSSYMSQSLPYIGHFKFILADSVIVWRAWVLCPERRWLVWNLCFLLFATFG